MDPTAQAPDWLAAAQQCLHREATHGDDHGRLHEFDLTHEERLALSDLGWFGIPIGRRTALERVGDVDLPVGADAVRARQLQCGQHAVEQLPGLADERFSAQVLLLARSLADDHPARAPVADAEDGVLALGRTGRRPCRRTRPRAGRPNPWSRSSSDAGAGAAIAPSSRRSEFAGVGGGAALCRSSPVVDSAPAATPTSARRGALPHAHMLRPIS